MPIIRATSARCASSRSGFFSAIAAAARSTASSSSSISFTESPVRLRNILRSSPSTLPNDTCTASVGGTSQPAMRDTSNTICRCCDCGAPTT